MFPLKNVLLLVVALSFAGGTAFYVKSWLDSERLLMASNQQKEIQIVEAPAAEVLVARGDMPAGTFLKPELMGWQSWPEDGVHENHIVNAPADDRGENYLDPASAFDGAVVRASIRAGEPITRVRVVHPGERGFLAAVLEPGFRAVSVPVDATTGIAGFVFPGDWVDVVMTMKLRGQREGEKQQRYFAQTVLERIRVLAVDQAAEKEDGEVSLAKTATLEVTAKEAERVTVALEMGRLSLSLHSLSPSEMEKAKQDRLVGGETTQPMDPTKVRNGKRSYTLDTDVYHMWGDKRLFPRQGSDREVHVMRGSESKTERF